MTLGGYLCMLSACGFVTVLFGWCCWKIAFGAKNEAEIENENDDGDRSK